ncbi:MAG: Fe-S protein assembly co-chaperone HscB [Bacteroidia bacterium]|nr:Fe-S protein assembly co-chaperone HscB [Bacteroidia bacterium]
MPDTSDYFSFYNLPQGFFPDEKLVREGFINYSRKFHPDFFVDDEVAQKEALEISSYNNKAYNTLKDFNLLVPYLLGLKSVEISNEKLPADFLMDMMDLNEQLSDLESGSEISSEKENLANEIAGIREEIIQSLKSAAIADNLEEVKGSWLKLKYLQRLTERL